MRVCVRACVCACVRACVNVCFTKLACVFMHVCAKGYIWAV